MGWILLFIAIFIIYQIVKPKGPKPIKMSAFDAYLIQQHQESQKRADKIPAVVPNINITMEQPKAVVEDNEESVRDNVWTDDLYLGMIKSGEYDTDALRKEAMEAMDISEAELDERLEAYKLPKQKRK